MPTNRNTEHARAKSRAYYWSHRESRLAKMRAYRLAHLEEHRARCRKWNADNRDEKNRQQRERYSPSATRFYHIKQHYGLSQEEYEVLFAKQDGLCAICGQTCKVREFLSVDHDHNTGKIRGLLCLNCNRGIGALQDSIDLVRAALEYLEAASAD